MVCRCGSIYFYLANGTQGLVFSGSYGWRVACIPGAGQQEIVHHGVNRYICASISDMRDKIIQFAIAPEQRKLLRAGARAMVQKYRPEVLAQQIVDLYEQLAN